MFVLEVIVTINMTKKIVKSNVTLVTFVKN